MESISGINKLDVSFAPSQALVPGLLHPLGFLFSHIMAVRYQEVKSTSLCLNFLICRMESLRRLFIRRGCGSQQTPAIIFLITDAL